MHALLAIVLLVLNKRAKANWKSASLRDYPFMVHLRIDPGNVARAMNCSGVLINKSGVLTDYFCSVFYEELVVCAGLGLKDCHSVVQVDSTETIDLVYLTVNGAFALGEYARPYKLDGSKPSRCRKDSCGDVSFLSGDLMRGVAGNVSCCNEYLGRFCNDFDYVGSSCPVDAGGAFVCCQNHVIGVRLSNSECYNLVYGSIYRKGNFKIYSKTEKPDIGH